MSLSKLVPVAHMGHDAPWLQIKTEAEVRERRAYIETGKPEPERPLRLKLLKIVNEPLPPKLVKVYAARNKAEAARNKAEAAWDKAQAERDEAYAAWDKAEAERDEAHAVWVRAHAAWVEAHAAWVEAHAAWGRAIVSREGVAFHKKVCGCAWTPKKPDILLQLATQQEGRT